MNEPTIYNLNLSPSYVPAWGAWEVAREVICNAIDADSDGMQVIADDGPDTLIVTTTTVPDLAQLLVVGNGSKRPGGDTIGQFGEGLKMAALAATRARVADTSQVWPWGMTIVLPGAQVSFQFRQVMGTDTLHAIVENREDDLEGCRVTIHMPGIANETAGKIRVDEPVGPWTHAEGAQCQVFLKGVYITTMKRMSLWDWNMDSIEVNRDRAMVSEWHVRWQIGAWLSTNLTVDMAVQLLQHSDSLEADALEYHTNSHVRKVLQEAFERLHGTTAVLAQGTESDRMAARKGHDLVVVQDKVLRDALASSVKTSGSVAKSAYDLELADQDRYTGQLARLRKLDDVVGVPPVSVRVFRVRTDELMGYANLDDNVLWLSDSLFTAGNDQQLVTTYLHEAAHFMSQAYDGSLSFENALDAIAGRLGVLVLRELP